ncbi:MAG: protein kinase [bacterium]|nr:protein kinase [bacterium]
MAVETIGRYEVSRVLGRGAMGVVYLAKDPLIDREVALKTLRVDLDTEMADEFRERFLREARAAGRLNHRAIVTIHDVGEDEATGSVFIAMEYIRGYNLKELLTQGHKFSFSDAARITADLGSALDYAHSMGVVHRDIKPANIILESDGTPKITDFGVARLESSNLTVEGQFIGTPNYMSPEQIIGGQPDGRSDLFSLGVVLFELLTGSRPFAGETMHEVTNKIAREPCPIPSTVSPGLPPAFNPVLLRILEKEPEKRFQSGSELSHVLSALARALAGTQAAKPAPQITPKKGRPAPQPQAPPPSTVAPATTAIAEPEEETRISARPPTSSARPDTAAHRIKVQRPSLLDRLPLPEFMKFDVNPSWVLRIVAPWALLCLVPIAVLWARVGGEVPTGPSLPSLRNLHSTVVTLHGASEALSNGDPGTAEAAALNVLDQAPSSPAARAIVVSARNHLLQEQANAETQRRVDEIVTEGRDLYHRGQYRNAADRFREALELEPEHEIAVSYLELSEERLRAAARRSPSNRTSRARQQSAAVPTPVARPTPGTSRITVNFNSPINAGRVLITFNGQTLADIPFDFTKKGFLGIKKQGQGQVKRVLLTPSGRHTLAVELIDRERGSMGSQTFEKTFRAGTDWALRIDLPKDSARAGFYLVESSR